MQLATEEPRSNSHKYLNNLNTHLSILLLTFVNQQSKTLTVISWEKGFLNIDTMWLADRIKHRCHI
jgi:hypothetical protein